MFPSVLPTYNRADIAFVRGEGPYIFAEDGSRYLDFGGGIAVTRSGPCASASGRGAARSGGQALAHVQSLSHPRSGAAGKAPRRCDLRRHGVLREFRRGGHRMRHQDGAALSLQAAVIPSASASSPSKARFTAARWRRSRRAVRRNISKASARRSMASIRCAFGDHQGGGSRAHARNRRHLDRADAGRGRIAPRAARISARASQALRRQGLAADLRRSANRHRPHGKILRL